MPAWLAAVEQVSAALPEQREVGGQGPAGGLGVGGGLFQGQRQPAQLTGQLGCCRLVRVTGARDQEPSLSRRGTSSTVRPGQCWDWLVMITRPGPAGGRNRRTDASSGALSKTSSHADGQAASSVCTVAAGSSGSTAAVLSSWPASRVMPCPSTVGFSAGIWQATDTSAKDRCAYSAAVLVLPTPPIPASTTMPGGLAAVR